MQMAVLNTKKKYLAYREKNVMESDQSILNGSIFINHIAFQIKVPCFTGDLQQTKTIK